MCIFVYLSLHLSIWPSIYLYNYLLHYFLSIYILIYLPIFAFVPWDPEVEGWDTRGQDGWPSACFSASSCRPLITDVTDALYMYIYDIYICHCRPERCVYIFCLKHRFYSTTGFVRELWPHTASPRASRKATEKQHSQKLRWHTGPERERDIERARRELAPSPRSVRHG